MALKTAGLWRMHDLLMNLTRRRVRVFPEWHVGLTEYTGVDYRLDELDDCEEGRLHALLLDAKRSNSSHANARIFSVFLRV